MQKDPNHDVSIALRLSIVERELLDYVVDPKLTKNRHILAESLDVLKHEFLSHKSKSSWIELQPEKMKVIF